MKINAKRNDDASTVATKDAVSTGTLKKIQMLTLAMKAAQFGSRPPIISSMTGLPLNKTREIFREVNGYDPIKGQLPSDTTFYISDVNCHLESAWLIQVYRMLSQDGDNEYEHSECMFTSYELYLSQFSSPSITFDRFFLLIRHAFFGNEITISTCNVCGTANLGVKRWDQRRSIRCPVCHLAAQASQTE